MVNHPLNQGYSQYCAQVSHGWLIWYDITDKIGEEGK